VCCLETLRESNFHIIILTEVWQVSEITSYTIPGYYTLYDAASFNQNDGLVIFVKSSTQTTHNITRLNEVTYSTIYFKLYNINFRVTGIYRPPGTNVDAFLGDLDDILTDSNNSDISIIVGDINLNLLDDKNLKVNKYINIMGGNGYTSLINKPTRVTESTSTCIDHILLKYKNKIKFRIHPIILQTDITDHYTTILGLDFNKLNNINNNQQIKKTNYHQLTTSLSSEIWKEVYESNEPERAYDKFLNTLNNHINNVTTLVNVRCKDKKLKPWITTGILNSIREREKKRKASLRSPNDQELKTAYVNYRNALTNLIKTVKNEYYQNKIEDANKNSKEIWAVVNEVTGRDKKANHLDFTNLVHGNKTLYSNDDKCSTFNNYFINICNSLTQNNTGNQEVNIQQVEHSFFMSPVTSFDIAKNITNLKSSSAAGKDKIPIRIVKENSSSLSKPFAHIINLIFTTGKIPHDFKESIVTPIYKTGDKKKIENYRPISLINNFTKIFERCVKERLINYLEKYNLLNKNQFGFRKGLSTEDALCQLVRNVYKSFENNKKCLAIFLDLTKAFDMVSHDLLCKKLEKYGIRGTPLDMFKNYLKDRKQYVRVGSTISEALVVERGVPQGTVLGPILFLIYVNELSNWIGDGKIISYADDTVLLYEGDTWENTMKIATHGISEIKKWLDENLLVLNLTKTHFMTFTPSEKTVPIIDKIILHNPACTTNSNVCSCNNTITKVEKIKYLGVIVDKHLRWNEHVGYLSQNLRKLVYKFYQLRNILSFPILKMIYNSLVESVLRYCIVVWGGLYDEHLQALDVTQKYIIKVMMRKPKRYSTNLLFTESKLFDIRVLYAYTAIVYLHKHELKHVDHRYSTRTRADMHLKRPFYRLTCCQRFIDFLGIILYNKVSVDIKSIKKLSTFKRKAWLFVEKNRYDLKCCIDTSSFA